MKKLTVILVIIIVLATPSMVFAQGMMGFSNSSIDSATIQSQKAEEQTGKTLLDQLKNKTTACQKLTNNDFEKIGEYFMGQAISNTSEHIAMNNMMKGMMGNQGEEQVHISWGKRGSGCEPNASMPENMMDNGMMGMMMGMMGGGANSMMGYGGWNNMTGGWNGLGWLFMILLWALVILTIAALVKWIVSNGKTNSSNKPLDMLKERYAKGEISKKEYEDKKRDLKG